MEVSCFRVAKSRPVSVVTVVHFSTCRVRSWKLIQGFSQSLRLKLTGNQVNTSCERIVNAYYIFFKILNHTKNIQNFLKTQQLVTRILQSRYFNFHWSPGFSDFSGIQSNLCENQWTHSFKHNNVCKLLSVSKIFKPSYLNCQYCENWSCSHQ